MSEKSSRWTEAPERGAVWAMRTLFFALNVLGYHIANALLWPIVAYFVLTGGKSRRASRDYLARLHRFDPSAPKPILLQIFLHHLEFAQTLLERALLWQGKTKRFRFSGSGRELLERREGSGYLLLGAHFGSFDALRILAQEMNCRVNVVMYRAHAQRINKFLEELNPDANLRVVELNPGDTQGVLTLKTRIEQGEHIAILADRLPPAAAASRRRFSNVTFLGSEAPFPESPWLLASLFNCPVLFVTAARTGPRTYYVTVESIAQQIVRQPDLLQAHIQAFARRLEILCRRHPRQWFNFYDFWQSDSPPRGNIGETKV